MPREEEDDFDEFHEDVESPDSGSTDEGGEPQGRPVENGDDDGPKGKPGKDDNGDNGDNGDDGDDGDNGDNGDDGDDGDNGDNGDDGDDGDNGDDGDQDKDLIGQEAGVIIDSSPLWGLSGIITEERHSPEGVSYTIERTDKGGGTSIDELYRKEFVLVGDKVLISGGESYPDKSLPDFEAVILSFNKEGDRVRIEYTKGSQGVPGKSVRYIKDIIRLLEKDEDEQDDDDRDDDDDGDDKDDKENFTSIALRFKRKLLDTYSNSKDHNLNLNWLLTMLPTSISLGLAKLIDVAMELASEKSGEDESVTIHSVIIPNTYKELDLKVAQGMVATGKLHKQWFRDLTYAKVPSETHFAYDFFNDLSFLAKNNKVISLYIQGWHTPRGKYLGKGDVCYFYNSPIYKGNFTGIRLLGEIQEPGDVSGGHFTSAFSFTPTRKRFREYELTQPKDYEAPTTSDIIYTIKWMIHKGYYQENVQYKSLSSDSLQLLLKFINFVQDAVGDEK